MKLAVGILEVQGFTPAMLALDAMEKGASISIAQAELNDFLGTVIKVVGELDQVIAAIEAGRSMVDRLGIRPIATVINQPNPNAYQNAILSKQEMSPLLQQHVVIGPVENDLDSNVQISEEIQMVEAKSAALGFIETQGFTAVFEAIDAACKAANVEVIAKEKLGGGYVTVVIRGDVAAVHAAVEVGKARVEGLGKLIAAHVIPRPSTHVLKLLPNS